MNSGIHTLLYLESVGPVYVLMNLQQIEISFNIQKESNITISISDYLGNIVEEFSINKMKEGFHQKSVDLSALKKDGIYKIAVLQK